MRKTVALVVLTLIMVGTFATVALASPDFSISEMQTNALKFIGFIVIIAAAVIAIKQFVSGQVVQAIVAILAGALVFVLLNVDILQALGESLVNFLTGGN